MYIGCVAVLNRSLSLAFFCVCGTLAEFFGLIGVAVRAGVNFFSFFRCGGGKKNKVEKYCDRCSHYYLFAFRYLRLRGCVTWRCVAFVALKTTGCVHLLFCFWRGFVFHVRITKSTYFFPSFCRALSLLFPAASARFRHCLSGQL